MSSTILKQAVRLVPRRHVLRTFSTSPVAHKDLVQELYIKELKSYKAPPPAKDAHVGSVKAYSQPSAPQAPSVPADLASELSAYDAAEPAGKADAASTRLHNEEPTDGGADAYLAFLESDLPKEEAHH